MTSLWTTADVAAFLSVSPEWVRDHVADLGGARLHDGPRAPLRFDPDRIHAHLERRRVCAPATPRSRRRPGPARTVGGVDLLPLPD